MTQASKTFITLGNGRNIQDLNGAYDEGYALALLPNGKMIWLGNSWANAESVDEVNPLYSYGWLNEDGTNNESFNALRNLNLTGYLYDAALLSSGSIVGFLNFDEGDLTALKFARFNQNGELLSSYGDDGILTINLPLNDVHAYWYDRLFCFDSAGNVYVVTMGANQVYSLSKYDANGDLDNTFASNFSLPNSPVSIPSDSPNSTYIQSFEIDTEGRLVLSVYRENLDAGIAVRYQQDGTIDSGFGNQGVISVSQGSIRDLELTATKSLWVNQVGADNQSFIELRDGNGNLIDDFGSEGRLSLGSGSIVREGYFTENDQILIFDSTNAAPPVYRVQQFNANGTPDENFGDSGVIHLNSLGFGVVEDVKLNADGSIIAIGSTETIYLDYQDFKIAKFKSDGTLDTSFDGDGLLNTDFGIPTSGLDGSFEYLADGKILITATINSPGADSDVVVIRLNADGSLDQTFNAFYVDEQISQFIDPNFTVVDPTRVYYGGLSVEFSRNGGASLDDTFSSSLIDNNYLYVDGRLVGQVTNNSGGVFKLEFYGLATQAYLNRVLGSIKYANQSDAPSEFIDLNVVVNDQNVNLTSTTKRVYINAVNDSPVGTVSILGVPTQGQTLIAENNISDADGLGAITYSWYANGSDNAIGTGSSYILTQADVGKSISVKARYTDSYNTAEMVASSPTNSVANVNDSPVGSVLISGTARQGQTLTATNNISDADGFGTITYQWLANGSAIAGALANTLTIGKDQVGKQIAVIANYTDGYGTAESVSSEETALVVTDNKFPTGGVTIKGRAIQNQKLTASHTLKDADGMGTVTYQWNADGSAINGANASTFTLTQAQVGKAITVVASYTDGARNAESVSSASMQITNVNDKPTGAVTISGIASQGQVLTASNTLGDLDGLGTISYAWYASKTLLGTDSTYTLTQADVGKAITLRANYTDGFGKAESATSRATAKVANVNDAPIVVNPIADQTGTEGTAFNFTLAKNIFTDLDKDKLVYSATGLPDWLKFSKGKLTGTPTYDASENVYSITIVADDKKGGTASDTFTLSIANKAAITGTAKADIINAGTGADTINGLAGNDTINGGQGIDIIDGGLGNDRLTGGLDSADYFRFSTKLNARSNLDTITDFVSGVDKIQLDDAIFTRFANNTSVPSTQLVSGAGLTTARDTDDYLIFNTTNGALYYDADGNGKAAAVQFATLLGVSSITHEDFMIV